MGRDREAKGGRNVAVLGAVSLVNDASSEMVFPLLPLFLVNVLGASGFIVGLIEGAAASISSILRSPAGYASDKIGRRRPFIFLGYGISALSKILLPLSTIWQHVLAFRFSDRVGKGVRTSPRDAMISESIPSRLRGRFFGLHRSLDTVGAVIGPLIAFIIFPLLNYSYLGLFLIAGLIGVGAVALIVFVKETGKAVTGKGLEFNLTPFSGGFRLFLLISALFTVGNFSYAFLVLRAQGLGMELGSIILLYLAYTIVYAFGALPAGILSDRVGKAVVVAGGYSVFGLLCLGFALSSGSLIEIVGLFVLYGAFFALTEGNQRALVSDLSPSRYQATGLGIFHTVTGLIALISNLVAGFLWSYLGPVATFYFGALMAFASALLLAVTLPK